MERLLASFVLTLLVSVMGIPAAYFVGQRSAAEAARREHQDALERKHVEQARLIESLKAQLADAETLPISAAQNAPAPVDVAAVAPPEPEPMRIAAATEPSDVSTDVATPATPVEIAPPAEPPIPESVFAATQLGTPYEAVVAEFGREGEPMMTLEDGAGSVTTQYAWATCDADGNPARIRLRFVDGRLVDKVLSE